MCPIGRELPGLHPLQAFEHGAKPFRRAERRGLEGVFRSARRDHLATGRRRRRSRACQDTDDGASRTEIEILERCVATRNEGLAELE